MEAVLALSCCSNDGPRSTTLRSKTWRRSRASSALVPTASLVCETIIVTILTRPKCSNDSWRFARKMELSCTRRRGLPNEYLEESRHPEKEWAPTHDSLFD